MAFTHDELLEIQRLSEQENYSSRNIAAKYGCSKSTINYFLNKERYKEFWELQQEKPIASGNIKDPLTHRINIKEITDKQCFIFTSAQNNTHVHGKFWDALQQCAKFKNAEIIVGTFTYNKSGFQNLTKESNDLWYDPKIRDKIQNQSIQITDDLVFSGELNILPTAKRVFTGMTSYTSHNSMIVPHTKIQLESVANSKNTDTKHMYSTGCCTQSNYINKRAGQVAAFDHIYGALLVETDSGGNWFARQLNAESDTGSFYDLDVYYTPDSVEVNHNCLAINFGDIHAAKLDENAASVSWRSNNSMIDKLKPKYVFLHDVYDQMVRNHHNIKDPYFLYKMFNNSTETVKDEVELTTKVISEIKDKIGNDSQLVIVESNHDLALQKWLRESDYKYDPVNAEFFLELQLATYKAMKHNQEFSVFEYACNLFNDFNDVLFLQTDDSFVLEGIEFGSHGDLGANGARGSINGFAKSGMKMNLGHSHNIGILGGIYYAGVLGKLDMGYNRGLSNWSHANIITYKNGKRSILSIKNNKFNI